MSNEIKRIGKGQLVKTADSQVVGRVVSWTDEEITVAQAGNNFEVTFPRDEMVRATKEEYAQAEDTHFEELAQADRSDEVEVEHPLARFININMRCAYLPQARNRKTTPMRLLSCCAARPLMRYTRLQNLG